MNVRCSFAVIWLLVLATHSIGGAAVRAAEPKYPLLDEKELLEKVKKTGAEWIAAGKAKGTKDLCKQLKERTTCPLALPAPQKEPLDDKQLYARACESIFIVVGLSKPKDSTTEDEWDIASATAFVVAEGGVLTTSRHFFGDPEPSAAFLAANCKGEIFPVEEILAADEKKDTCLFRIPAKDLKPLSLGETSVPGARVRIVSHPGYFFYYFSAGSVSNFFRDEDKVLWMNVTADFGQGASGAPAFDECGNVVGQVASTLTLYAGGPLVGDPMVQCRRLTSGRIQYLGSMRRSPRTPARVAEEKGIDKAGEKKEGSPPAKDRPQKPGMPPMEQADAPGDPQMVFRTCVPVDSLRSLVTQPKPEPAKPQPAP